MSKQDALASIKGHQNQGDAEVTERTRTERIAWGFHQIYRFRDVFKAAGLLTDGMELILSSCRINLCGCWWIRMIPSVNAKRRC
ncbi:MAG: hypothetical protein ACE5OZ_15285 [Candidatus Heimdallarchaeota archaeon]